MNAYIHQYGVHSPGTGGAYNAIWNDFREKNRDLQENPWYMLGFGFGLFDQVAPLLAL
jgi:hypothetical protein